MGTSCAFLVHSQLSPLTQNFTRSSNACEMWISTSSSSQHCASSFKSKWKFPSQFMRQSKSQVHYGNVWKRPQISGLLLTVKHTFFPSMCRNCATKWRLERIRNKDFFHNYRSISLLHWRVTRFAGIIQCDFICHLHHETAGPSHHPSIVQIAQWSAPFSTKASLPENITQGMH